MKHLKLIFPSEGVSYLEELSELSRVREITPRLLVLLSVSREIRMIPLRFR
jgi:hypothetical protein